jgi:hypothetical protein
VRERVVLQDDQPVGLGDRRERVGVAGRHVAVEIGTGERDDRARVGMRALPARDRLAAAARVQREHRDRIVAERRVRRL